MWKANARQKSMTKNIVQNKPKCQWCESSDYFYECFKEHPETKIRWNNEFYYIIIIIVLLVGEIMI